MDVDLTIPNSVDIMQKMEIEGVVAKKENNASSTTQIYAGK